MGYALDCFREHKLVLTTLWGTVLPDEVLQELRCPSFNFAGTGEFDTLVLTDPATSYQKLDYKSLTAIIEADKQAFFGNLREPPTVKLAAVSPSHMANLFFRFSFGISDNCQVDTEDRRMFGSLCDALRWLDRLEPDLVKLIAGRFVSHTGRNSPIFV